MVRWDGIEKLLKTKDFSFFFLEEGERGGGSVETMKPYPRHETKENYVVIIAKFEPPCVFIFHTYQDSQVWLEVLLNLVQLLGIW